VEAAQGVYYWIRLAILLIVVVLAVVMAVRQTRWRSFSTVRAVLAAAGHVVAYLALLLLTGVSVSLVWSLILFAIGLVAGYFAGRTSHVEARDGGPALKRASVGPVIAAVAYLLAAMTLLFGTSYLFALAMVFFALSVGVSVGQAASEMMRAAAGGSPAGPEPASAASAAPGEAAPPS
jgi:hypothetical protein